MNANKTRTRIFWTDSESKQVLADAIAYVRLHPGRSLIRALNCAQDSLPGHRRRRFVALRAFSLWRDLEAGVNAPPPPEEPPVPEPVIELRPVTGDWRDNLREMPTPELAQELLLRLTAELASRLSVSVLQSTQVALNRSAAPAPPGTLPPSASRRRRIVVIGLLRDQFRHVLDRVSPVLTRVDVVFHDKEGKEAPPPADHYIIQRHSSHRTWEQAKAHGAHVSFVAGGVTGVAARIREVVAEGFRHA